MHALNTTAIYQSPHTDKIFPTKIAKWLFIHTVIPDFVGKQNRPQKSIGEGKVTKACPYIILARFYAHRIIVTNGKSCY